MDNRWDLCLAMRYWRALLILLVPSRGFIVCRVCTTTTDSNKDIVEGYFKHASDLLHVFNGKVRSRSTHNSRQMLKAKPRCLHYSPTTIASLIEPATYLMLSYVVMLPLIHCLLKYSVSTSTMLSTILGVN